jgi:DNA-binding transcriptional LysR family regulator
MRYSLRQLEVFLAVAATGNVSRAAERLSLSQSATSSALAELEKQFDVQLFDRIGKRLRLSSLGQAVRAEAEATMDQATNLQRTLEHRGGIGPLRVGATLTIGNYLAVPILARFLREHPGTEVKLSIANTREIERQVANFEVDVGLVEGEIAHPDLEVRPWLDDMLTVFCAPEHPLAKNRGLRDEDLLAAAWIVREQGSGTRQAFDRAMVGLLPGLRIALVLEHTEAIIAAVKAGLGIGCVSRLAVAESLAHGTVMQLRVPTRNFARKFFFVFHRDKVRGPGIESWCEVCRAFGK